MHLSLSTPTYPRSGNGWGFVVICQHNLPPVLGLLSKNFHCFWNPYTTPNVGDLQHKIVPRHGEFIKQLLQMPNNPHPCSTWGRWGMTIGQGWCIRDYPLLSGQMQWINYYRYNYIYTLLDTAVNINIQQSASYFPARGQKGIPMNLLRSRRRKVHNSTTSRAPLSVADPHRVRS